ncbi:putative oligopeptide transporter membrane permease Opp-2B [Staphylococcus carnosus]|nr:peptide ABC transporter permease [Staphylococcus carnosus]UTB87916.1 peptide ABC transporter permease [Staphylococcus carnosus]UTB90267.1 peptide ABC transporter permease [Staphylococcus carnosus]GEP76814.1 peptide ABC transporter permease [Staphylococcus carnosus]SUL90639.1 putative oligopeptide transporter membrane permease Opp-2B [Staphylococcus carnosus]
MIIKQILSRLGQMIIVLFVLSTITFILMKLSPGDPVNKLLHIDVANVSQDKIDAVRDKLGLNQPVLIQWWEWFTRILHLDFGTSIQTGEPVMSELLYFTPPTLIIAGFTLILTLLISVSLGTIAAVYYHTWLDRLIRILTSAFVSIPSFFLGIILIYLFSQKMQLLPSSGIDSAAGYIMPVIALSIGLCAYHVRLMRSTLIDLYQSKEVAASRARGMSERYILFADIFKPALIPVISILGMSVGGLIGSTVVIENLFDIPGICYFLVESIRSRDYPVVQGAVLMIGCFVVVSNAIADIIVLFLDPKQRYTHLKKKARLRNSRKGQVKQR